MRSDLIKKGPLTLPQRAMLKAMTITDQEMERPFVAVVNSKSDLIPGHIHLNEIAEAVGKFSIGEYTEKQLKEIEDYACPGCGSCAGMYTANSMNCLTETLGLALPGNGRFWPSHRSAGAWRSWPACRSCVCWRPICAPATF